MIFRTTRCLSLPRPAEQLKWSLLISESLVKLLTVYSLVLCLKKNELYYETTTALTVNLFLETEIPRCWFPARIDFLSTCVSYNLLWCPHVSAKSPSIQLTHVLWNCLLMRIRLMCSNRSFRQPLFFQYVRSLSATIGVSVNRCSFSTYGHQV